MSSASGYMGEKYFQEFGPRFMTCPQLVGTWVKNVFRNLVPKCHGWKIFSGILSQDFDMPSASGYMGETYFQEFGPKFMTCPQLVGTWVKNIFRNLVPNLWHVLSLWVHGSKIFSEIWSQIFSVSTWSAWHAVACQAARPACCIVLSWSRYLHIDLDDNESVIGLLQNV